MSVVVVVGSIERVRDNLQNIKDVIDYRKTAGWRMFHHTEEWLYLTFPDRGEVCPICEAHGVQGIFSGYEVRTVFPDSIYGGAGVVYPRTHMPDLSKFADTPCHCELHIQNLAESLEKRLHEEKLEVVL